MKSELQARTEHTLQITIDLGERLFVLVLFATFVVQLSHTLVLRPYNLLVMLSEGLVAFLILIRRGTPEFTMRPLDWVIALAGSASPMLQRAGGMPLLPPMIGAALMFAGLIFAIWAKASLRQSFGVAAANRGAVGRGAYRVVRHPMYAGYIVVYLGFCLNNPLIRNLSVDTMAVMLLIVRILAEERLLMNDDGYVRYRSVVRYRLLPGIF